MAKKRENAYDLLKILSAFGVVVIHVSAVWLTANTNRDYFGELYSANLFITCLWNIWPRFAVPCFMMISGALLLSDEQNADYAYFYKKQFKRIGVPMFIFVGIYLLYGLATEAAGIVLKGHSMDRLLLPIMHAISGEGHMWYLYAMAGVYAVTPVIIKVKHEIGERNFAWVSWIYLTVASLGFEMSDSLLMWDIGFQLRFVGYFLAGYEIRRIINDRKNNLYAGVFICVGGAIEYFVTYVRYLQETAGISEDASRFPVVAPLCPWIVVASICIFAGFSFLNVRRNLSSLAGNTFMVYLVHAGVWDVLFRLIKHLFRAGGDSRILIPSASIIVFVVSFLFAKCIKRRNEEKCIG